jgi:hypothetical protein
MIEQPRLLYGDQLLKETTEAFKLAQRIGTDKFDSWIVWDQAARKLRSLELYCRQLRDEST